MLRKSQSNAPKRHYRADGRQKVRTVGSERLKQAECAYLHRHSGEQRAHRRGGSSVNLRKPEMKHRKRRFHA